MSRERSIGVCGERGGMCDAFGVGGGRGEAHRILPCILLMRSWCDKRGSC